jgi:hypothetical protein
VYGSGTTVLFEGLPELRNLAPDAVRRVLSTVYAEILSHRLAGDVVSADDSAARRMYLRRLAAALESYAVFDSPGDDRLSEGRVGAAFIAAEALSLAADLPVEGRAGRYPYRLAHPPNLARVEAGLLYLIAGFDVNATPCARGIPARSVDTRSLEARFAEWACDALRSLMFLRPQTRATPRRANETESAADVGAAARAALFEWLGQTVSEYLTWLGGGEGDPEDIAARLAELEALIAEERAVEHADIHHLARLLQVAIKQTASRGLRTLPAPPNIADAAYADYLAARARGDNGLWPRPLLWPPAVDFVQSYVYEESRHVVVNAPTGSGKSAIAEIALSREIASGWAVYLAPTNALANQVRNDLAESLAALGGTQLRSFVGDAEYNLLEDESVGADEAGAGTVVVMTPEKCALALRLRPQLFASCRLVVFDECHLLREGSRGALAELVLSHILALAPQCRVVLMSAMLANPADLATWLQRATGEDAAVVREPWRPTRTMRAVVGLDHDPVQDAAAEAVNRLRGKSPRFRFEKFSARHALLLGLRGPWVTDDAEDYVLLRLPTATMLKVSREPRIQRDGWTNATTASLTEYLARSGYSTLAFTPADPHHAFSVAARIRVDDVAREEVGDRTSAYLLVAEDELGTESRVATHIRSGVAVHTAALIDAERLGAERAFREGSAVAMTATGTLAQGLNLPATAVVVAGTIVGDRRDAATPEGRMRAQSQLLNALGRAGRAGVTNHGLGVVVPENLVSFETPADSEPAKREVSFIASDDDSTDVSSALRPLVKRALAGELDVRSATPEELVAYSYLPYQQQVGVSAAAILARTLAITERNADREETAASVADAVVETGLAFLESTAAPAWLTAATYRTGLPFFQALRFQQARERLLSGGGTDPQPATVQSWLDHLFAILELVPPDAARAMLGKKLSAPRMRGLWATNVDGDDSVWEPTEEWLAAWHTISGAVTMYLRGDALASIAHEVLDTGETVDPERTTGDKPLPRLIAFTNNTMERISRLAGLLVACEELDPRVVDQDAVGDERDATWLSLALLPLAVRCGCGTPSSLGWFRFGIQLRRPAHILARTFPIPADVVGDTAAREWVGARLAEWLESDVVPDGVDEKLADALRTLLG